jgi:hypothetical protein
MASGPRLDLFLADADAGRPVLQGGLPGEALTRAARPKAPRDHDAKPDWARTDADPNDLAAQGWAVIATAGPAGDRQLEAIQPLIRLREQEQGAPAKVYRVEPDMTARRALDWKSQVFAAEEVPEEERPQYLLMLGDLNQTSLDLQHMLAHNTLVGRVHFTGVADGSDLQGYAAYAEKAVRHALGGSAEAAPDLLYYVSADGTSATQAGRVRLVEPGLADSERQLQKGVLPAASVRALEAATVDQLIEEGAGARPSVLLSVSHGMGAPLRGWGSAEAQQRRQGAMVVGPEEILDAERMRGRPFLPGGMWFLLACFGAGTPMPASSSYHAWLSDLAAADAYGGDPAVVLHSLPLPEWRPFVAALPQAALANPEGPLGIISHVDLAWSYGFSDTTDLSESRRSRIQAPLHVLVRGSRAGVALGALMDPYRSANDALLSMYQMQKDAQVQGRPDPTDPRERGNLWMLRNDLRGYVLLGDPAARLPLQGNALRPAKPETTAIEVRSPAPPLPEPVEAPPPVLAPAAAIEVQPQAPAVPAPSARASPVPTSIDAREAAVIETLCGELAPRAIAERAGVPLATLWEWIFAYRAGGRARLGE